MLVGVLVIAAVVMAAMCNATRLEHLFPFTATTPADRCTFQIGLSPLATWDMGVHTEVRTITTWNVPSRCLSKWSTKAGHPPGLMPIRSAMCSSAPGSQP